MESLQLGCLVTHPGLRLQDRLFDEFDPLDDFQRNTLARGQLLAGIPPPGRENVPPAYQGELVVAHFGEANAPHPVIVFDKRHGHFGPPLGGSSAPDHGGSEDVMAVDKNVRFDDKILIKRHPCGKTTTIYLRRDSFESDAVGSQRSKPFLVPDHEALSRLCSLQG